MDQTNNSSPSTSISTELIKASKSNYRRRSSLFKPEESVTCTESVPNPYPPDYEEKLEKNLVLWSKERSKAKKILKESRKPIELKNEDTVADNEDEFDSDFYLKYANDFCTKVNLLLKLEEAHRKTQLDFHKSTLQKADNLIKQRLLSKHE